MSVVIAVSRILLPVIALYIIIKCLIALLFGRPRQNIIAHLQDSATGQEYDLNMWESAIGRSKACDIVLSNPVASRFHAVIARRVNGWYVYDLNSKNGIRVNGKKIDGKSVIEGGDVLTLGDSLNLKFIVDNDPIIKVSKRQLKQMQREAERRRQRMNPPGEMPYTAYKPPQTYAPKTGTTVNMPKSSADTASAAGTASFAGSFENVSSNAAKKRPALISPNGKIYYLSGYSVSIGNGGQCTIRITDPEAEAVHSSVDLYEDGSWVISNLSRKGTTFLNGTRVIEPYILIEGDRIKVAGSNFTYTERV